MRLIGLVVPAVALLLCATPTEAARRGDQPGARPSAARVQTASRSQTLRLASATAAPLRSGRPAASTPTRQAAACVRGSGGPRGAAARCGATRVAWQGGLAPAAGVQTADCPEGTMATLATGHARVVRCMPI